MSEDVPTAIDVKDAHRSQISCNPTIGNLECGPVTVEESGERATVVYSTRSLRASKLAKEDTRTQKKKCA